MPISRYYPLISRYATASPEGGGKPVFSDNFVTYFFKLIINTFTSAGVTPEIRDA